MATVDSRANRRSIRPKYSAICDSMNLRSSAWAQLAWRPGRRRSTKRSLNAATARLVSDRNPLAAKSTNSKISRGELGIESEGRLILPGSTPKSPDLTTIWASNSAKSACKWSRFWLRTSWHNWSAGSPSWSNRLTAAESSLVEPILL